MKPYVLAEAPNQEEQLLGVGVSNSNRVYLRIGENRAELKPEKAVEFAHGIMQAAQIAIARGAAKR